MTNPPPVAPVWAPQKMYVQFAENGNIRKWTSGPSSDADHMQMAKVYFRLDGDFAALVLAGNKLLDTIDAHDSEKEPLSSNHPDVHAFSNLLDKMPPADMQAVASGELERLRAENEKLRMDRGFAIGWITALANNPYKPMTWMQTREAAADCLAALQGDAP